MKFLLIAAAILGVAYLVSKRAAPPGFMIDPLTGGLVPDPNFVGPLQ